MYEKETDRNGQKRKIMESVAVFFRLRRLKKTMVIQLNPEAEPEKDDGNRRDRPLISVRFLRLFGGVKGQIFMAFGLSDSESVKFNYFDLAASFSPSASCVGFIEILVKIYLKKKKYLNALFKGKKNTYENYFQSLKYLQNFMS